MDFTPEQSDKLNSLVNTYTEIELGTLENSLYYYLGHITYVGKIDINI